LRLLHAGGLGGLIEEHVAPAPAFAGPAVHLAAESLLG
jgi:hypothetical protein